jgi:hypothetical protein
MQFTNITPCKIEGSPLKSKTSLNKSLDYNNPNNTNLSRIKLKNAYEKYTKYMNANLWGNNAIEKQKFINLYNSSIQNLELISTYSPDK